MGELPPFVPFTVSISRAVLDDLRALIERADEAGHGDAVRDAARRFHYLLRTYPDFGQPYKDLLLAPLREWIACVPPLVLRYVLDEERKLVLVARPFAVLPRSGF